MVRDGYDEEEGVEGFTSQMMSLDLDVGMLRQVLKEESERKRIFISWRALPSTSVAA